MADRYFAYLEEGKPLLLLDLKPEPPRTRRRSFAAAAAASALLVAGVSAVGALPAEGIEVPTKVLQSVAVDLGTDGTIHAVTSDNVRRTQSETSTDTTTLDPQKVAGQLPVRVLTSYKAGDRTGTDLKDLKGTKGRVEVTVTVQNATVRPELLTYDAGSVKKQRYALVGVPLTVTAAATLPKGAFAQVVRPVAGQPGTNGVVGQDAEGRTTVQWSALLAPPQLSSSAAFTLVQDAKDFRLPELHLAVQTGLATDTSLERLLQRAFDKDASGSALNLQYQAIETVRKVGGVLDSAAITLAQIKAALDQGGDSIGNELIDRLRLGSDAVASSASSLDAELRGLKGRVQSDLDKADADAASGLLQALDSVRTFLGDPTTETLEPPTRGGAACDLTATGGGTPKSLYGQAVRVSQQLDLLRGGTDACRQSIVDALLVALGDPDACPTTPAKNPTLACTLTGVRDRLGGLATYVSTKGSQVLAQFKPSAVTDVRSAVSTLVSAVADLQDKAARLGTGTTTDTLDTQLQQLSTDLKAVLGLLSSTGSTGLVSELTRIHATAMDRMTEIGGEKGGPGSVSAQARALADALCSAPPVTDPVEGTAVTDYLATWRAIAAGKDCSGAPAAVPAPFPSSLVDRVDAEYLAWSTVFDLTDVTDGKKGTGAEVKQLVAALTTLTRSVDDIRAAVDDQGGGSLKTKVARLRTAVAGLYSTPTPGASCSASYDPSAPPLNALAASFSVLDCNQKGLDKNLAELVASAVPSYTAAATAVGDAARAASAAREQANTSLAQLLGTLTDQLRTASDRTAKDAKDSITDLQGSLAAKGTDARSQLERSVDASVKEIQDQLDASNADVQASSKQLSESLGAVQLDLGDRTGARGLLGVVRSAASRTDDGKAKVDGAGSLAERFGRLRDTEVDEIALQSKQFRASLDREAAMPAFGLSLPQGSTSVAVFTFHLRAV